MTAPEITGCIPDRLRRLVAAGCAALVLVLGFSAVSPSLHALFHTTEAPATETDDCAVMLFAGGTDVPVACVTVAPVTAMLEARHWRAGSELFLVSPRYLRQPERGPPLVWIG